MERNVFITRVGKFLPNDVVLNDDMEKRLGMIGGRPSRIRPIILRQNRIKKRYYSINEDGAIRYSNAELMANAIKGMLDEDFTEKDIELLSCGTSTPDQLLPSHTSMVHGLLKNSLPIPIMSPSGVCCAGAHALQYGYLSVLSGNTSNAVCGASELVSPLMLAKNYSGEYKELKKVEANPYIAFDKDFLRWMLSDGAGCVLLCNKPSDHALSLKIDWIESVSFANELPTCMYQGVEKGKDGNMVSWKYMDQKEWLLKSIFSIKQDIRLLGENIVAKAVEHIRKSNSKHNLSFHEVNYFLPHISSMYFYDRLKDGLEKAGIPCSTEKWFTNLTYVGNVGSASIYIILDELFHSGKLKDGDKVYLFIPESGRFSFTTALLTAVKN